MDETRPMPDAELDAIDLSRGRVLGKCRIERRLGRGGMGAVYLARHANLDLPVAVKVMNRGGGPAVAERFLREARLAARIDHPNVVRVLDADRDPATGLLYIVQELVEGGTVAQLLEKGPLPEPMARQILAGVLRALSAAAERGIVHRDVKPENILLTPEGEPKLADLGLAKELSQGHDLTATRATMGTPAYMSPEQIVDSKRVDARSDLYSLGATWYHMLVGHPPFVAENVYGVIEKVLREPAPNPRAERPDVSEVAARLCLELMEKEPARRPQSAADALRRLVPGRRAPRPRRKDRTPIVAGAIAAGILAAVLAIALVLGASGSPEPAAEPFAEREPEPRREPAPEPDPDPGPAPDVPPRPREGLARGAVLALDFEPAAGGIRNLVEGGPAVDSRGDPETIEGRVGQALRFDGVDDDLSFDGIVPGTIAFWVQVDGEEPMCWFTAGDPETVGCGFMIGPYRETDYLRKWRGCGQGIAVGFYETEVLVSDEDVRTKWRHFVFSWDARSRGYVAVDGVIQSGWVGARGAARAVRFEPDDGFQLPEGEVAPVPGARTHVGRATASWFLDENKMGGLVFFRGELDELAIWDRQLSRAEMKSLKDFPGGYCRAIAGR